MLKNKRTIAMITCFVLLFALLFSMSFIAAESSHTCAGEHCLICQEIQLCRQTLKTVGAALLVCVAAASFAFFCFSLGFSALDCRSYFTPVSLKVKLTF